MNKQVYKVWVQMKDGETRKGLMKKSQMRQSKPQVPEKCSLGGRSIDAVLTDLVAVIQVPQLLECQHRQTTHVYTTRTCTRERRSEKREREESLV